MMFAHEGWTQVYEPAHADFICFTGGADVSPELYGEANTGKSHTDLNRDKREIAIFNEFKHKCFLGICRGGQFLNVMAGGKLRQHINGHQMGYQEALYLPRISDPTIVKVHEDHHQEILPRSDAHVFLRATADDVVEGCWYPEQDIFCFQPHPEWGDAPTKDLFFREIYQSFAFN